MAEPEQSHLLSVSCGGLRSSSGGARASEWSGGLVEARDSQANKVLNFKLELLPSLRLLNSKDTKLNLMVTCKVVRVKPVL